MLADFCLRLALGLAAALVLLLPRDVAPRFYRVQCLVILGLLAGAAFFSWSTAGGLELALLGLGMILAYLGSLVWMLEGSPGGPGLAILTFLTLAAAVPVHQGLPSVGLTAGTLWGTLDAWTAAALLGSATSAMLLGHAYLVAPGMAIAPLLRLLLGLFAAILLRMVLAGVQLSWNGVAASVGTNEGLLWLPLRWGLGFLGPLILGGMAWQCARIRSTQSATGILYVVVVLCFIGELTSQLLHA